VRDVRYFAYGTLQQGFSNYERFASNLGVPLGRYRTVEPFPLVVPREPACTNAASTVRTRPLSGI
jgi:gamma-glutamylcyclotransferase (GGCT)/AIG2-like uncharacterized protein YtfP